MSKPKIKYDKIGTPIPNQYLKTDGSDFEEVRGANGGLNVNASIVGSLAKLSTEPFPTVVEGYSLIEFYPNPNDNKFYKGYLGEWREI